MRGVDNVLVLAVALGVLGGFIWFVIWSHRKPGSNEPATDVTFGDDLMGIPPTDPVSRALQVVQVRYATLIREYDKLQISHRQTIVERDLWKERALDLGYFEQ